MILFLWFLMMTRTERKIHIDIRRKKIVYDDLLILLLLLWFANGNPFGLWDPVAFMPIRFKDDSDDAFLTALILLYKMLSMAAICIWEPFYFTKNSIFITILLLSTKLLIFGTLYPYRVAVLFFRNLILILKLATSKAPQY